MKNLLKYFLVYLFELILVSTIIWRYDNISKKNIVKNNNSNSYVINK